MNQDHCIPRTCRELSLRAAEIRKAVFDMAMMAGGGHIAPGLSCTDILTALYYGNVLRFDPAHPAWADRDRFILSKGHGCMPLYVILADLGFFPRDQLATFARPGGILGCHADSRRVPGIEATTGSLGLGLAVAVGMAFCAKHDRRQHRVFALLGDGESQEGAIWESAMYAGSRRLDNLTIIIDHNGFGATAPLRDTADVAPMASKLEAFRFSVREVDGHDFRQLSPALAAVPFEAGRPSAIVARTVKGKGIRFMEAAYAAGDPKWHYRVPKTDEERTLACNDLDEAIRTARNALEASRS